MNNWPIEAKVGQMMMFGFSGTSVPDYIRKFIQEYNLGGIIMFSRNIDSAAQIAELNSTLQKLALDSPFGVGLFISIDQEGGQVIRIKDGVSAAPAAMAVGALASPDRAYQIGKVVGEELASLGFSINLAPCVDVNNNPHNPVIGVRSFGEDPELVADLGEATIKGLQESVLATAKHFPGHGDTAVDSHYGLPVINHARERLEQVELLPFRRAIASGVQGILSSHVVFPAIEPIPGRPASLSNPVLTGLLRSELGYDGLILTDCMEMQAVTKQLSMEEAAILAVEAGNDMVLISHTQELQERAFWAVVEAVKKGRISEERINESLARISKAKRRFVKWPFPDMPVGSSENQALMEEAYGDSITVVRGSEHIPLPNSPITVVEVMHTAASLAEEQVGDNFSLAQALADLGAEVKPLYISAEVTDEEYKKIIEQIQPNDLVVMVTQDAHRFPEQARLVNYVVENCPQHAVVGTRTPYELAVFPDARVYLVLYSNRPEALRQGAAVLLGRRPAVGRLPVSIPN